MALKTCFQLSLVCNSRASVFQSFHHRSAVDKVHLHTISGLKFNKVGLSFTGRCTNSRVVCKASDVVAQIEVVKEANWNELVIGCKTLVLVNFWAPWCGPCRVIEPDIAKLAKEYAGKITSYKLTITQHREDYLLQAQHNTDDSPNIRTKFGIRSIRTGEKRVSLVQCPSLPL